jgi:hypothetical protein
LGCYRGRDVWLVFLRNLKFDEAFVRKRVHRVGISRHGLALTEMLGLAGDKPKAAAMLQNHLQEHGDKIVVAVGLRVQVRRVPK